jgi:hypothetical protein
MPEKGKKQRITLDIGGKMRLSAQEHHEQQKLVKSAPSKGYITQPGAPQPSVCSSLSALELAVDFLSSFQSLSDHRKPRQKNNPLTNL